MVGHQARFLTGKRPGTGQVIVAVCVCGYLHSHIPHECWRDKIKPGTRAEVKPRCKCGALHAHIPHDCSTFPEKPVTFDENPETLEKAQAQWDKGWRPKGMCKDCPKLSHPCRACWVKAGYPADRY